MGICDGVPSTATRWEFFFLYFFFVCFFVYLFLCFFLFLSIVLCLSFFLSSLSFFLSFFLFFLSFFLSFFFLSFELNEFSVRMNWPKRGRIDQNEYELTKWERIDRRKYCWVRIDRKMSTSWPKWERIDLSTNWLRTYQITCSVASDMGLYCLPASFSWDAVHQRVNINLELYPADTWRLYNVASTSMQRHDVASTLRRRCINVMCSLGRGELHTQDTTIYTLSNESTCTSSEHDKATFIKFKKEWHKRVGGVVHTRYATMHSFKFDRIGAWKIKRWKMRKNETKLFSGLYSKHMRVSQHDKNICKVSNRPHTTSCAHKLPTIRGQNHSLRNLGITENLILWPSFFFEKAGRRQ